MKKEYQTKPMREWTEEDFAQDHADRMKALAELAAKSKEEAAAETENEA